MTSPTDQALELLEQWIENPNEKIFLHFEDSNELIRLRQNLYSILKREKNLKTESRKKILKELSIERSNGNTEEVENLKKALEFNEFPYENLLIQIRLENGKAPTIKNPMEGQSIKDCKYLILMNKEENLVKVKKLSQKEIDMLTKGWN